MDWLKPTCIIGVLAVLIIANAVEFRIKRRSDQSLLEQLPETNPSSQLLVRQYRQTQNIEQLLHVISSVLIAILVALLWQ